MTSKEEFILETCLSRYKQYKKTNIFGVLFIIFFNLNITIYIGVK